MSDILNNIDQLNKKHGNKIHNDKKLLLAYWILIDRVEILDKTYISTADFLKKATNPIKILNAKNLYEILKKDGDI